MLVTNLDSGKEWVFNCGRWLDKKEDDGQTVRELLVSSVPPSDTKGV